MNETTPTDRYVFDTYVERAATVYSLEDLADGLVVVTDDALVGERGSMPQVGDYLTIAGNSKVVRGRMARLAYVVEPES